MDNLTHSLLGAALAELALREATPRAERRLFLGTGLIAANLPDIDIAWAGLTPAPLGYLLHHRGHTHTVLGLVVQGVLAGLLCLLLPAVRRLPAARRAHLAALLSVALASHLLLDAWNSYGVHPFHPFDSRWYYGDAIFIFEPWLWLFLGVAAAGNARGPAGRVTLAALCALPPLLLASASLAWAGALAALAAAMSVGVGRGARRLSPRARAATALAASSLYVGAMFGLSAAARAEARRSLERERHGEIVDVVLTPNPASPVCWSVIAVDKDERAGEYLLHRGTLSLLPAWQPPTGCASHRIARLGPGRSGSDRVVWSAATRQPLDALRALGRRDCWTRAWLQFGRAPVVRDGTIFDLRFDNGPRDNFTAMPLPAAEVAANCPPHLTRWAMPRADLLEPAP